jgi:aspartyl-tRNA(Asn)/glutamyl-tRNA(Gln) amidotransferase subunit C
VVLSREQVQHIATLSRLGVSERDLERFSQQLSVILEHFERLRQVDTEGVPLTAHTLSLHNVMREDEAGPCSDKEEVLANAPLREGDHFRVAAILEE